MTSVERVVDYTELEPEKSGSEIPDDNWPLKGSIKAKNVYMKYASHLPDAIHSLSFNILPKEKVSHFN